MLTPETPISELPQARGRALPALKRLGIRTVRDLLFHFPVRYEDYSNTKSIADISPGETVTIEGRVAKLNARRSFRKRMALVEATVEDNTGNIKAIWFNQPFMARNMRAGDRVRLSGKITQGQYGTVLSNPAYERLPPTNYNLQTRPIHTGGLIAIYPETQGITSRWIRFLVDAAFPAAAEIKDPLPEETRERHQLPGVQEALHSIHFPEHIAAAKTAEQHFTFENLLFLQLRALEERSRLRRERAPEIPSDLALIKQAVRALPFALTNAQRRSLWEIMQDLARPAPMNRLLNGDVGSGKTVVAALACLLSARAGYRAVVMTPTEILARQHFETFRHTLAPFNIDIALFTGASKTKRADADIIIGTHALIQKGVTFDKLGLVVIDEQHRFGVEQRAALTKHERTLPHFLSMTATPIPRTLALTVYGNLDVSVLDELPKSRLPVITRIAPPDKRQDAYEFMRSEVRRGRQIFVICPRIESQPADQNAQSELRTLFLNDMKAVKEEYEKLSKDIFPDLRVAMLHGRMKPKEKDAVMRAFKAREFDMLVSTSVVEVGVDVPNATVMAIEGAERFGLAQLHQFRGRVGRGGEQSYCMLFPTEDGAITRRLKAMIEVRNGFELAERDLQIRGPGELMGTRQWGVDATALKGITDPVLVRAVREEAVTLVREDPTLLKWPALRKHLTAMEQTVHEE